MGCSQTFGMPSPPGTRAYHLYYLLGKMILIVYGVCLFQDLDLKFVNFAQLHYLLRVMGIIYHPP